MTGAALVLVLLALAAVAFHLGRKRAFAVSAPLGGAKHLHSLPGYYGSLTALWCAVPAVIVLGLWLAFESRIVESLVVSGLPEEVRALPRNAWTSSSTTSATSWRATSSPARSIR